MSLFSSMQVSASGLTAERTRLDVIADNLANANTTRTPEGGPFVRRLIVLASREASAGSALRTGDALAGGGVRVLQMVKDTTNEMRRVYEPGHPDADANGYVTYPNVNVVTEMVDMITATRAYEANIAAVNAAKSMAMKSLEIGK